MKESGRKKCCSASQSEILIVKVYHFWDYESCHTDIIYQTEHALWFGAHTRMHFNNFALQFFFKFELGNLKQHGKLIHMESCFSLKNICLEAVCLVPLRGGLHYPKIRQIDLRGTLLCVESCQVVSYEIIWILLSLNFVENSSESY